MKSWAVLSPDGKYRYALGRVLNEYADLHWPRRVCWVMLNPSTADAEIDDPTIKRVKGFTEAWGYTAAVVVNLYSFRATDPNDLRYQIDTYGELDAIGPLTGNHHYLNVTECCLTVCAWGSTPWAQVRARDVLHYLRDIGAKPLCLGLTQSGAPKHPLYLPKDSALIPLE